MRKWISFLCILALTLSVFTCFAEEDHSADAASLDAKYFTAESFVAFQAAVEESATAEEQLAARDLLAQSNERLPMALFTNVFYQNMDVYTVSTPAEFAIMADAVKNVLLPAKAVVYQTCDLDMTEYPNVTVGKENTATTSFNSTYDGQGFTIRNATITGSLDRVAVFPYLRGTLKNLTFENCNVTANGWSAVAVACAVGKPALMENVHVKNCSLTKVGTNNGAGLLLCQPRQDGHSVILRDCTVSGCTFNASNTARRLNFGWILSKTMQSPCRVESCYAYNNTFNNTGSAKWKSVGDIIGESICTTIVSCGAYNNTYNTALELYGGIVGGVKTYTTSVEDCYTDAEAVTGEVLTLSDAHTYTEENNHTNVGEALADGSIMQALNSSSSYLWEMKDVPMTAPLGDADGNGTVNTADVVVLMQHLVGYEVSFNSARADLNRDDHITIFDAVSALRKLAEEGTAHMLDGKKIIFIGNSLTYYGKTVIVKSQSILEQEPRNNDTGLFYQLCKENGANVSVTNWTWGGHTLVDTFGGNCAADRGCDGVDHLSYLTDRYYDYVVIQPGSAESGDVVEITKGIMDVFRAANPNVKFIFLVTHRVWTLNNTAVIDALPELEKLCTVVRWGDLVYDLTEGNVQVPGGSVEYDKFSFVVNWSEKDGYHPNMLSGYIITAMTYCAITGEKAVDQGYSFVNNASINSAFDFDAFDEKYYTVGPSNYREVFKSKTEMDGLRQLMDQYLTK